MGVELETLVHGMTRAVCRFVGDKTPPGVFPPTDDVFEPDELVLADTWYASLFESLNWAVALDDRLQREWIGDDWAAETEGGEMARAIRHARNSVHHDWAEAFEPLDDDGKLFQPWENVVWLPWRETLPKERPDPVGKAAYEEYLAGESVGNTLLNINQTMADAVKLLRWAQDIRAHMLRRTEERLRNRDQVT